MSWEENVRKVTPYTAGEQPSGKVIKLNTNECPYAPSPAVSERMRCLAEMEAGTGAGMLRKYPDMNATALVKAVSEVYGIPEDRIFAGVGSDDVLSMAFMAFFNSDTPVIFPDITYSFYDVWSELHRIPYRTLPLDEDFRIVPEDYLCDNGGVILPNPNAPTGVFEDPSVIEKIIDFNRDRVVIIDEAYVDFGGKSVLPLIDRYDNLLVVQTFSKSRALAGLRIGLAFGQEKLIGYLKDVKFAFNSYTMNVPAIELGAAAVRDTKYFEETVRKIIRTRERTKKELRALCFSFADSEANFVFAAHERKPAEEIFKELRARSIYVRWWNKPRISNHLRITIGTDEEMDTLFKALKEIVS
ncbi:MAG: histidinol-phosphate transaminase [Lachnospiraceae bacterium]|nr:histidinol-phosphate transaminase [Lachnospiraceae bacterium]